jgi:hypothetical protein
LEKGDEEGDVEKFGHTVRTQQHIPWKHVLKYMVKRILLATGPTCLRIIPKRLWPQLLSDEFSDSNVLPLILTLEEKSTIHELCCAHERVK